MPSMAFSILCVIPARSGSRGLRHKNIQKVGGKPMLVAADLQRPAAINQLQVLGQQLGDRSAAHAPLTRPHARAPKCFGLVGAFTAKLGIAADFTGGDFLTPADHC